MFAANALIADALSIQRDPALAARRTEIRTWLRAHGLDLEVVYRVRVIGPLIRVREYQLNEQGRKFIRDDKPAMRTRWVWLRKPPPKGK